MTEIERMQAFSYLDGAADGLKEARNDVIEELRKLWLQIYNIDELDHDFEGFYHCQNEALELINKRIEELKGENK